MEQIKLRKYNQIISQLGPSTFSNLMVVHQRPCHRGVHIFYVNARDANYQLYVSDKPVVVSQNICFLETSPRVNIYQSGQESIIIEEKVDDFLSDYILFKEHESSKMFAEHEAQNVLKDINESIKQYRKHDIAYPCISAENIVRCRDQWMLGLPGLLLTTGRNNDEYLLSSLDKKFRQSYALGCLFFKMLFGFLPFEKAKKSKIKFSTDQYLQHLENEKNLRDLKTYYFLSKLLTLSTTTKDLLDLSLSGELSFEEWCSHPFFLNHIHAVIRSNKQNTEVKMIERAGKSHYSLALAALEYKKRHPLQKLNSKEEISEEELSYRELMERFSQHDYFKGITFLPSVEHQRSIKQLESMREIPVYGSLEYFWQKQFDPQEDRPCIELLKLIQADKDEQPHLYQGDHRQSQLKMYAFPYAMVFQLARVQQKQLYPIRNKINQLSLNLLQVSTIYTPHKLGRMKPLHGTQRTVKKFEQIKQNYRTLINELYQHFMKEAIRKYNIKNQHMGLSEKRKNKEEGLNYYRLCLKLLEASLLIRKQGRHLHLQRIETSQRKEIENDINELLKQYFPNKADIS